MPQNYEPPENLLNMMGFFQKEPNGFYGLSIFFFDTAIVSHINILYIDTYVPVLPIRPPSQNAITHRYSQLDLEISIHQGRSKKPPFKNRQLRKDVGSPNPTPKKHQQELRKQNISGGRDLRFFCNQKWLQTNFSLA